MAIYNIIVALLQNFKKGNIKGNIPGNYNIYFKDLLKRIPNALTHYQTSRLGMSLYIAAFSIFFPCLARKEQKNQPPPWLEKALPVRTPLGYVSIYVLAGQRFAIY